MRNALLFVLTLFGASLCLGAEIYPSKPVRVIVNFGPGGSIDIAARVISQQLSEQLGITFIVENRPGAGGTIGSAFVAKSAPDGYTLMMMDSNITIVPGLYKSLPFDVAKDFTPITQIQSNSQVLVVPSSFNVNTLKEFIALAQANPGKFNYGSAGIGTLSHLSAERFKIAAGVNIKHIMYKGGPAVVTAILGGEVQMLMGSIQPAVLAQVKSGKLRALAVTTDGKRSPVMPDVPSMSEVGVSGMTIYTWIGLGGPAGMPKEVVNKLHAEVVKAIAVPSVKEQFIAQGAELVGSSSEEFSKYIRNEMRRWAEVIKSAGITAE